MATTNNKSKETSNQSNGRLSGSKSDQTSHRAGSSARGFAAMPHERVQEIGRKGGEARAEQLGHEGYVELGHMGGEARAEQLGHEGYVELGHKGGSAPHTSRGRSDNQRADENKGGGRRQQASASRSDRSSRRGFASQPKEKVREVARKGGENSQGGRSSSRIS